MDNTYYLQEIYSIILQWNSNINFIIGVIQFVIVCFVAFLLYKLFNIFF